MPLLSAITTCKGRLEHLKATLPTLMALPDCEVVVVDFDCPEGAGDWVAANHPAARVIRVAERPFFNIAEARNRGASAATGDWLLLTDADVLVAPGLSETIGPLLRDGLFLRPMASVAALIGTLVVARDDFVEIGGYDQVFEGWGSEDIDLMTRLVSIGRRVESLPDHLVASIPHDDAARGRFHQIADPRANVVVNALYRQAKMDLWAQGLRPDEAARRKIYAELRQAALTPGGVKSLEISFRQTQMAGHILTASLRYQLKSAD
jgi:glycosyltransferase involved in cell wall biosynthesis